MTEPDETLAGQRAEQEGYERTRAILDALERGQGEEEIAAALAGDRVPTPGRTLIRCRRCRQGGYAGQYPFSTLGGVDLCDDCV